GDNPVQPWYAPLIVRQQMHSSRQSRADHVDVLRSDPRNHNETILSRDEIQERRTWSDDATWRMNPQFGDGPILRRFDFASQRLIIGSLDPLSQLEDLVLYLA